MNGVAIDVLIPTRNRPYALAMTLTALAMQTSPGLRIVISDQSDVEGVFATAELQAVLRVLSAQGTEVQCLRNWPLRGMAEQRAFLLAQSTAPACLFLDDDVLTERDLIARLHAVLRRERCGFVGSALHGLSFLATERPHQQAISLWNGPVIPESIAPGDDAWARHHLHSAANLFHVQRKLGLARGEEAIYRVAWVGGCVLFDAEKLRACGGFEFWRELPAEHCGEDVLAQLRVMARFGGCGLIPSGAYHMELPTTVTRRPIDAPFVLPTVLAETE